MDCVFCEIVAGNIPCYKVYEDDNYLSFLDIRPLNLGHLLVIPKKHYRWVWDDENIWEYYKVVWKIANAMKKSLDTDYVVSLVFWEEVNHAHVWLVPRFSNDGHGASIDTSNVKDILEEKMKEIAEKISINIS